MFPLSVCAKRELLPCFAEAAALFVSPGTARTEVAHIALNAPSMRFSLVRAVRKCSTLRPHSRLIQNFSTQTCLGKLQCSSLPNVVPLTTEISADMVFITLD